MKKILFVASALLLAFNAPAFANIKIGVVDLNKVLLDSPQRKKAETDLKNKFEKREKSIVEAQKKFQKDIENFSKNSPAMKKEEQKKEEQKIIDQQKKLQEMQNNLQTEANAAQQKAFASIVDQVKNIINKIAADKKLDMVVAKSSLPFNKKELEITDEVIKQLKK